jgi:hypothetical protein
MRKKATENWLTALGYQANPEALHVRVGKTRSTHPYGREVNAMLSKDGGIGATAVFDVDNVPTVCFVEANESQKNNSDWLSSIRQKIWNQNLVSLLMVVDGEKLIPYPIEKDHDSAITLSLSNASENSPFSIRDIQSGDVQKRHTEWFAIDARVDRELLKNLHHSVLRLIELGLDRDSAQFLLGQCLFVSYLEHREIVSPVYRERRQVGILQDLIATQDTSGLTKLFKCLKRDFNGDFLDPENAPQADWKQLDGNSFQLLNQFLSRVDIETGQGSLWNYDFRYIPVELISGIYETFLGDDQETLGAYYTPRHLANLAVDHAFQKSLDVANEIVFDGACGSGILLTTAFRRMISAIEHQTRKELSFKARSHLLEKAIRGGDVSKAACRVTAFSLYLSLMEDLQPSDILLLQDDEQVKLPTLIGKTILCGDEAGDFFSSKQRFANKQSCTIFLSNPPWFEPPGNYKNLPYEEWAKDHNCFLPHRQIAAAFAHKALETIFDNGRVCLILPVKLFTAPTSQRFLKEWLTRCQVNCIINFSDIRRILFSGAVHPCVIVTGQRRPAEHCNRIPHNEFVQYWVPKADVSIAFGRLTIHSADRQQVLAQEVAGDNQVLRTYLWGGDIDAALIGKLAIEGTISDLTQGSNARWQIVKGFNQKRHSSPPLSVAPLKKMRFLNTRDIPRDSPVLDRQLLRAFPSDITSVVSYGSQNGAAFTGPRVLFPDGASAEFEVNAVFASETFCFKHSVAAICGPKEDEDLLRFLTMYLRSSLVRYLLLHTAYSLVAERPRITLGEVNNLPFIQPLDHINPNRAKKIVTKVADITRKWEQSDIFTHFSSADKFRAEADRLIFEYFGLTDRDSVLVEDACSVMIPSVQPNRYLKIRTGYCDLPTAMDFELHSNLLEQELLRWQQALGGKGAFNIQTIAYQPQSIGAFGIVCISLAKKSIPARIQVDDKAILKFIETLKAESLVPMQVWSELYLIADFLVQAGDKIYLIKPLVKRLWLRSQALVDAKRIVDAVRYPSKA